MTVTDQKQNPQTTDDAAAADLPEQLKIRREKRARLLAEGKDAYPVVVDRTRTLSEILAAYAVLPKDEEEAAAVERVEGVTYLAPGEETTDEVGVAGEELHRAE